MLLASKCMHNFSPHVSCDLSQPKNTLRRSEYAHCILAWKPNKFCIVVNILATSEDFANYKAYLEIISTSFVQYILSVDTSF